MRPSRKVSNLWMRNWLNTKKISQSKKIPSRVNPCQRYLKKSVRQLTASWSKPSKINRSQWRSAASDSGPREIYCSSRRTIKDKMSWKSSRQRRRPSKTYSVSLKRWTARSNRSIPTQTNLTNRCRRSRVPAPLRQSISALICTAHCVTKWSRDYVWTRS